MGSLILSNNQVTAISEGGSQYFAIAPFNTTSFVIVWAYNPNIKFKMFDNQFNVLISDVNIEQNDGPVFAT